ncbi:hypothetical protein BGZ54_004060, partial [Gamsiella multidivaricata]
MVTAPSSSVFSMHHQTRQYYLNFISLTKIMDNRVAIEVSKGYDEFFSYSNEILHLKRLNR